MKNIWLLFFSIAFCGLLLVGCKEKSSSAWYPVEGGYINLENVNRITSEASMILRVDEDWADEGDTIIYGKITSENINGAIQKLKDAKKNYTKGSFGASINFDNFTVRLNSVEDISWENNKDLIELLKMWLNSMDDVSSRLKG